MSSTPESTPPDHEPGQEPQEETGSQATAQRPSLLKKVGMGIWETLLVVLIALTISAVFRALVGQVFVIPSSSMEDTVHVGDRVFAVKPVDVHRGDIIVFRDPGGWVDGTPRKPAPLLRALELAGVWPDTSTTHLIKRLVGLPGDTVECCDPIGRIKVNGVAIDEPYLKDGLPAAAVPFKVVVPTDRFFAMGDNRNNSRDSRCHLARITNDGEPQGMRAFVPLENIVGPAKFRLAPLDRVGNLRNPGNFAEVPAPSNAAPDKPTIMPEGVGC